MRRRDKHSPCVRMMKKIYERLRERLGHKPTVKNFDAFLVTLGPDERESWKMDVCSLGYGDYYRKMPGAYRKFIRKYMEHDRECERCYIRKYTVRGLASHLREAGHSAEAVSVLAGKREVTDEF